MIFLTDLQLTGKLDSAVFSKDLLTFLWLSSNLVSLTKKAWVLRLMVLWQISVTNCSDSRCVGIWNTFSLPNRAFGLFFVTHPTDSKTFWGLLFLFDSCVSRKKRIMWTFISHCVVNSLYHYLTSTKYYETHTFIPIFQMRKPRNRKLPTLPRVTPLVRGVGACSQGIWLQISCSWLHVISCLTLADRCMISTLRIAFLWSAFFSFCSIVSWFLRDSYIT